MADSIQLLLSQYHLVTGTREVLLNYCADMAAEDYVKPMEAFVNKSIRDLQVHIANTYLHWLANRAMKQGQPYAEPEAVQGLEQVRALYRQIDALVPVFLTHFNHHLFEPMVFHFPARGRQLEATPFSLFTHVLTHEFHHKGQQLSMGRLLGYMPPPDTDIIRL